MKITRQWLHQYAGKNGGWKQAQLRLLGVPWPPTKGWVSRLVLSGTCIDEDTRRAFERAGDPQKITPLKPIKEPRQQTSVRRVTARRTVSPRPPDSHGFLRSFEWRSLRMRVLTKFGARCQCCGATPADGVRIHVDHIKPRRLYPELALVESNLQVLCEACNHGKGNWDQTDWRTSEAETPAHWDAPMWWPSKAPN